jgi:hypothetical protein
MAIGNLEVLTDVKSKLAHSVIIVEHSPEIVLWPSRMAPMPSELSCGSRRACAVGDDVIARDCSRTVYV